MAGKKRAVAVVASEPVVSTRPPWLDLLLASGFLDGESFAPHRTLARAIAADPLTDSAEDVAALALYRMCSGRQHWPLTPAAEVWDATGRGGGKSSLVAKIAACKGATFDPETSTLAAGEVATIMLLASDRAQSQVILNYLRGCFQHPALAPLLAGDPLEEKIVLRNRVEILVATSNYRATRGRSLLMVAGDEISFWDRSVRSNPDSAVLVAVRPGLRLPGSLGMFASTTYARRGAMYEHDRAHFGREQDPILVWRATTEQMNPSFNRDLIARAVADDASAARAEYFSEYRGDLEQFLPLDVVEAAIDTGVRVRDVGPGALVAAFCDPAGGGGPNADSFTLAFGHPEWSPDDRLVSVVDEVIEARPPYNVDTVVATMAEACRRWGVDEIIGDYYAGVWPSAAFGKYGLRYIVCTSPKSTLFLESLVLFTGQRIRLPDNPRLKSQLVALERRTARGGKDSVAHPPTAGSHDDLANVACGVAVLCQTLAGDLAASEAQSMSASERAALRSFFPFQDDNIVVDRETMRRDVGGWGTGPDGYCGDDSSYFDNR